MNKQTLNELKATYSTAWEAWHADENGDEEALDNFNEMFYNRFTKKDIYNYLINTYIERDEVVEVDFFDSRGEYNCYDGEPIKWHGELKKHWYQIIDQPDYDFCHPKLWKFKTNRSKTYFDFERDIIFFRDIGAIKYRREKGISCKKTHGNYDAEMKGSKTSATRTFYIIDKDEMDD
jgi:hypothetical protein